MVQLSDPSAWKIDSVQIWRAVEGWLSDGYDWDWGVMWAVK